MRTIFVSLILLTFVGCQHDRCSPDGKIALSRWPGLNRPDGNVYYNTKYENGLLIVEIINNTGHPIALRRSDLSNGIGYSVEYQRENGREAVSSHVVRRQFTNGSELFTVIPFLNHSKQGVSPEASISVSEKIKLDLHSAIAIAYHLNIDAFTASMERPCALLIKDRWDILDSPHQK